MLADRYERRTLRLFASSLLFADTLFRALRDDPDNMPADLPARMETVGQHITDVEAGKLGGQRVPPIVSPYPSPQWQACSEALRTLEEALNADESVFEIFR